VVGAVDAGAALLTVVVEIVEVEGDGEGVFFAQGLSGALALGLTADAWGSPGGPGRDAGIRAQSRSKRV
jgi:hypothetical protein